MKCILSSATLFQQHFYYFCAQIVLSTSVHTCSSNTYTVLSELHLQLSTFFTMEGHKYLNKKLSAKCKQTVDLKKMLQMVEGGFNTQEINSAFDYDTVSSSEDESVILCITSSDESESSSENEDVSVIPPTPKKRKINEFVKINNSKIVTTCTKGVHQHVQGASGASGSNQSNSGICDLSEQPSLNTLSTDNTSCYQVTG